MIEFEDLDIVGCDVDGDRVFIDVDIDDFDFQATINRSEIIQICQKMGITVSELLGVE